MADAKGTITQRLESAFDELQNEFKSLYSINDFNAKLTALKKAGNKSDRPSILSELYDMFALYYSLPAEISKKRKLGERWLLADVEKSLDQNNEKNSSLAIQYHLYDNPMYKGLTDEDKEMNVVVFGFGKLD